MRWCSRAPCGRCGPPSSAARGRPATHQPNPARSRLAFKPPRHSIELIEIAVVDVHDALLTAMVDRDLESERVGDALLERHGVGVLAAAPFGLALRRGVIRVALAARPRLDLADVEAARDDLLRE